MTDERMIELLNNFIEHLTECNSNTEDTIMSLKNGIGMKQEEWEELGWNLTPYEEIEFFEGDEGDLAAENYANENNIDDYDIEWDYYRQGYSLKVANKNRHKEV
jgi:hypothetical protein